MESNQELELPAHDDAGNPADLDNTSLAIDAVGTADSIPGEPGADDESSLETELLEMENAATALQKEGLITEAEAAAKKEEVAKARTDFRSLPREQRAAIIKRRREIGMQLLARQLPGAAVVRMHVRLDHTRLRGIYEQWMPYFNRMSVNLPRFGPSTFGRKDYDKVNDFFEVTLTRLEEFVDECLQVAQSFREMKMAEMRERDDIVFEPTVTLPSVEMDIEVYSRLSMRLLNVLSRFDQVMGHLDFLTWNGVRDQSDYDEEVNRFLRKFHPLGLRAYTTHLKLMVTVRGL